MGPKNIWTMKSKGWETLLYVFAYFKTIPGVLSKF